VDLNKLLSQMALELSNLNRHEESVETVTQYARIAVDADDAGIMLVHARNRVETPAGTSKDVDSAHQLQAELGEGPCLDAAEGGDKLHTVPNIREDERWPKWGPAAADLGYMSTVGISLEAGSRRIGSLNIYWREPNAFNDDDVETTVLLAGHASVALAAADMRKNLEQALDSRTTIGQAEGILMQAFDIDAAQAFAYMRRLSQDQNVKLAQIAETIIENRVEIGRDPSP
jgi:GAF domain-containing protein